MHITRLIVALGLLTPLPAVAQDNVIVANPCASVSCAAIGNGVDFSTTAPLFAQVGAMAAQTQPFGVSFWVYPEGPIAISFLDLVSNRGNVQVGWEALFRQVSDAENLKFALANTGTLFCSSAGQLCLRQDLLTPNTWHHICIGYSNASDFMAFDGYVWDRQTPATTYLPNTSYLAIAQGGNPPIKMRDVRIRSGSQFSPLECQQFYVAGVGGQGGAGGQMPTSGILATPLYAWWKLNDCTGSPLTCPDSSGHSPALDLIQDGTPSCSIVSPSGTVTGSQTLVANCTDNIAMASVVWTVDGAGIGSSATAPNFSVTWNSARAKDGVHTLGLVGTNVGGTPVTVTESITTANSVASKTVYLDPTSLTDCPTNNGLSPAAPCSTIAGLQGVINALGIIGGDSILQKAGTTAPMPDLTAANTLSLAGLGCTVVICKQTQNTYPGLPITLGTYGGTGQCTILSGVVTDCASMVMTANGTVGRDVAAVTVINVPNFIMQNFRIFGSQPNAIACPPGSSTTGCAIGIKYSTGFNYANGGPTTATVLQNNEVLDFYIQMFVGERESPDDLTSGQFCGVTVQNSFLHASTVTTASVDGLLMTGGICSGSVATSSTVTGNYTQYNGNGIVRTNGFINYIDTNNVTTASGGNAFNCTGGGSGYGNWQFEGKGFVMKGNEAFNIYPPPPPSPSCNTDNGAFDFDNGISQGVGEFNYGHNTFGPLQGVFQAPVENFPEGPNTVAYNLFENGGRNCLDNTCAIYYPGGGAGGPSRAFNNVAWSGFNGTPAYRDPAQTVSLSVISLAGACPVSGLIANNILVSTSSNGTNSDGNAGMISGGFNSVSQNCQRLTYKKNDYYPLGGGLPYFWKILREQIYNSVADWNAASGDTGISVNPNFAGTGGSPDVTCYSGTGIPPPVYTSNCPIKYQLQAGNALSTTGLDLTVPPYSTTLGVVLPPTDYYQNAIPNGVGTGYPFGADAKVH